MSTTWFVELNQATDNVREVSGYLVELGSALQLIGNSHLSAELSGMARILSATAKSIQDTAGRKAADDCAGADAASATIVKAALAGATVGRALEEEG